MEDSKNKKPTNLKYLVTTRRYLFVAIGVCVGSLLIFFTIIFPKIQDIQLHRTQMEKEQKALDQLNQKSDLLANASGLSAFQEKNRVNTVLPSVKPLLPVIHQLEAISGESGVIVSSLSLSPGEISTESAELKKKSSQAQQSTEMDTLTIEMIINGSVDQINKFVSLVNTMSPITDLSTLSLSRSQSVIFQTDADAPQEPRFEARLILASYFLTSQFQPQFGQILPDLSQFDETVLAKIKQFPVYQTSTTTPTILPNNIGKENLFE